MKNIEVETEPNWEIFIPKKALWKDNTLHLEKVSVVFPVQPCEIMELELYHGNDEVLGVKLYVKKFHLTWRDVWYSCWRIFKTKWTK